MKILHLFFFLMLTLPGWAATTIQPSNWWAGMKNSELQLLLMGKDFANASVEVKGQGIAVKEVVHPTNPDYLIVYLDIAKAPAQTFDLYIKRGKKTEKTKYSLLPRETRTMAQGFTKADVLYLLMPDRFANGNPKNDVVKGMAENKVDRKAPFGRHGGDLEGVRQHLDYFTDLGVTALWLNPVQENNMKGGSYHGYAITDYYKIDARLGSNHEFRRLVDEAHAKGLKVVMDMIFNHCGSENPLFTNRPAEDWFNFDSKYVQTTFKTATVSDTHAAEADRRLAVDGWFTQSMPDWNQRNRHVATYLIQNSIWWIEFAGIDGIRQDTHPYADFDFMAKWCKSVMEEYPHFNIVGETWLNSNAHIAYWQKDSRLAAPRNSELPTVMDFPLFERMGKAFEEQTTDWNDGLFRLYDYISQDFIYENTDNLLVFLDNHDTSRFFRNASDTDNFLRYKQALTYLMTTRGIPQIYYGMEVGMYADKSEGDGKLRNDFPGGWKDDATSCFTREGRSDKQNRLYDFTAKLLHWRKTNPAILNGKYIHYTIANGVYVYARVGEGCSTVVVMNGTNTDKEVNPEGYRQVLPRQQATEFLSGIAFDLNRQFTVKAHDVCVFNF